MDSQLLLLFILLLLASTIIAVPLRERREEHDYMYQADDGNIKIGSGDRGFFDSSASNEYTIDDALIPEYMTALYECWQKKDEENEMKNCLQSVDEILEIDEIVNFTNTITGFIGQGKKKIKL